VLLKEVSNGDAISGHLLEMAGKLGGVSTVEIPLTDPKATLPGF
jgi:hypothetical protein